MPKRIRATAPNVLEYDNYADFLNSYYAYKKKQDSTFSYRKFALQLDLRYHSHIRDLTTGKRKLSVRLANKIAKKLKMNMNEAYHLELLACSEDGMKIHHMEVSPDSIPFYEGLLCTLADLKDFRPDPVWIEKVSGGIIAKKEAVKYLRYLISTKQLIAEKGKWKRSHDVYDLTIKKKDKNFHREIYPKKVMKFYTDVYCKAENPRKLNAYDFAIPPEKAKALYGEIHSLIVREAGIHVSRKKPDENQVFLLLTSICQVSREAPKSNKKYL